MPQMYVQQYQVEYFLGFSDKQEKASWMFGTEEALLSRPVSRWTRYGPVIMVGNGTLASGAQPSVLVSGRLHLVAVLPGAVAIGRWHRLLVHHHPVLAVLLHVGRRSALIVVAHVVRGAHVVS